MGIKSDELWAWNQIEIEIPILTKCYRYTVREMIVQMLLEQLRVTTIGLDSLRKWKVG
jgi:hypothetical protein